MVCFGASEKSFMLVIATPFLGAKVRNRLYQHYTNIELNTTAVI